MASMVRYVVHPDARGAAPRRSALAKQPARPLQAAHAVPPARLTPEARADRAMRTIVSAIDELIAARLAGGFAASEWVDQCSSPLGRRRHLALVRSGVLRGVKEGRRVLVRRSDLDAYLAGHRPPPTIERDDDVEGMIRAIAGGIR